jgi:glutamate-1-semialdehyde 2,1-aminomutase
MNTTLAPYAVGAVALTSALTRISSRLTLSRAKHPSLAGHANISRRVARQVPFYEYAEQEFFGSDDAPEAIVAQRRAGFMRLAALYKERFAETARRSSALSPAISDMQFTAAYRVPFQFRRVVQQHLKGGSLVRASRGVRIEDLDGNELIDLTGSYGVNVLGYDFYKECLKAGAEHVAELGPVLGPYHPVIEQSVERLKQISGLDEVSFHMSGTEAVMQAVRLARYHTRRTHLVRFCGAYHGWWGDVQPGVGNPVPAHETYTLHDLSEQTLAVLRRRDDIACVLVNPLQALHPNMGAPSDGALVSSGLRAHYDRPAYTAWLKQVREVCTERGIVLIFDEVFSGFRLAPGGGQQYFGIQADLVTYGKTLGGGLPIGVVCGSHALMKRFRDDRPADVCFARGTFNSHPYVMGAMHEFLQRFDSEPVRALYDDLDATWDRRAGDLNARLQAEDLPVRIDNMQSIWVVSYTRPSRYNWMFQYYLRAEGLALSWTGTGRLIFSLNFRDADCAEVNERFVRAARAMREDGFWWSNPALTDKQIKRRILKEMLKHRL